MNVCSFEGCSRRTASRLCLTHSRQLSRRGYLTPIYGSHSHACSIESCSKNSTGIGILCLSHAASAGRYTISHETYADFYSRGCAVCKRSDKKLCVDHDHSCCSGGTSCGKCVRGMVCHSCNLLLAGVDKSGLSLEELMKNVSAYYGRTVEA